MEYEMYKMVETVQDMDKKLNFMLAVLEKASPQIVKQLLKEQSTEVGKT